MVKKVKTPLLFEGAHWLDLAIALSDRSLTMAECARHLGLATAVIRRPLLAMVKADLVEVDDDSLGRGTHYWLREDLVGQVELEVRAGQQKGFVTEDQVVLAIHGIGPLALARALVASDLSRIVIWVAELGPTGSFLAVLDGSNTSATMQGRLIAAIEGAGGTCTAGRVGRVMDAEAWRRLLASYRDAST